MHVRVSLYIIYSFICLYIQLIFFKDPSHIRLCAVYAGNVARKKTHMVATFMDDTGKPI